MAEEKLLLCIEAQAAVKEVSFAVNFVEISKQLPNTDHVVYMNITTKEDNDYCVQLSVEGFRIVSKRFERINDAEMSPFYETIYALLDNISIGYRCSFGDALASKLSQLSESLNQQSDEQ